jgi:hypothetical protein
MHDTLPCLKGTVMKICCNGFFNDIIGDSPCRIYRVSKKFPVRISPYDKDFYDLLMSVDVGFPTLLSQISNSFNPIKKGRMQVF